MLGSEKGGKAVEVTFMYPGRKSAGQTLATLGLGDVFLSLTSEGVALVVLERAGVPPRVCRREASMRLRRLRGLDGGGCGGRLGVPGIGSGSGNSIISVSCAEQSKRGGTSRTCS